MIQFNLLPEVKLEYVKARRTKYLTVLMSLIVIGVSVGVVSLLFFGVQIVQKKHSSDLSNDITSEVNNLKSIKDLEKILTVQNQLNSLPALHDGKPVATRLIGYLQQLTPTNVTIAELTVNYEDQTIEMKGAADAIGSVNKFADTLKFTNYKTGSDSGRAFSEVVLSDFGKDDKGTSYQLSMKFDEVIFSNTSDVVLEVPAGKITTRSQTEKPGDLFDKLSNPQGQEN